MPIVASASMFHAKLAPHLLAMRPEIDARTGRKFRGAWNPESLDERCRAADAHPIENVLEGFDIDVNALDIAATTLVLSSPATRFGSLNLCMLPLGVAKGASTPTAGSLELYAHGACRRSLAGPMQGRRACPAQAARIRCAGTHIRRAWPS